MAYATVAELAEHLGWTDNLYGGTVVSTEKTAKMTRALTAASDAVDEDTHRVFTTSTSETRNLMSYGGDLLWVPDLVSVSAIVVDDNADGTYETTLAAADYELHRKFNAPSAWPHEYIARFDDYWPRPEFSDRLRKVIRITGVWGWSAVPEGIKQATLLLASRYVQRGNAALGVQSVGDLGGFGIRSTDPDYMALIDRFVKELPGEPNARQARQASMFITSTPGLHA
jgi:hypothetical protein